MFKLQSNLQPHHRKTDNGRRKKALHNLPQLWSYLCIFFQSFTHACLHFTCTSISCCLHAIYIFCMLHFSIINTFMDHHILLYHFQKLQNIPLNILLDILIIIHITIHLFLYSFGRFQFPSAWCWNRWPSSHNSAPPGPIRFVVEGVQALKAGRPAFKSWAVTT